jgi:hypothetical protein
MTVAVENLGNVLGLEFSFICSEPADVRAEVGRKDTPAHRAALSDVLTRIDALLDMFLEAGGMRP